MKSLVLGFTVVFLVSGASVAQSQNDRRCARHHDREQNDRCNCTAQSGGTVVSVDSKGINRWDLPQAKAGAFVACMKSKGYRM